MYDWPLAPTSTAIVDGSLGGDVQTCEVGVASIAKTAVFPNLQVALEVAKLMPVTVTTVPPATGPDDGDTENTIDSSRMLMKMSLFA